MPISPNNLQFSLPTDYIERLRSMSQEGESIGLTAKRIIISVLDANREEINSSQLAELVDRITAIEVAIDCEHFPEEKVRNRLTALEEAIAALQYQVNQATSPVKRPSSPPPHQPRKK
jgi:hypothetical protein